MSICLPQWVWFGVEPVCLSVCLSTPQAIGNIQRIILGGCGLGGAYSHINSFSADSADPYGDGQGRETPRLCVH